MKQAIKPIQKSVALLIATCLCLFCLVPTTALAAPAINFSVSTASGAPGQDVSLVVSIANNPGLAGSILTVGYDPDSLTLKSITPEAMLTGKVFLSNVAINNNFAVMDAQPPGIVGDGSYATLVFEIKDGASPGQKAVSLAVKGGIAKNVVDESLNALPVSFTAGSVNVVSANSGDKNTNVGDAGTGDAGTGGNPGSGTYPGDNNNGNGSGPGAGPGDNPGGGTNPGDNNNGTGSNGTANNGTANNGSANNGSGQTANTNTNTNTNTGSLPGTGNTGATTPNASTSNGATASDGTAANAGADQALVASSSGTARNTDSTGTALGQTTASGEGAQALQQAFPWWQLSLLAAIALTALAFFIVLIVRRRKQKDSLKGEKQ